MSTDPPPPSNRGRPSERHLAWKQQRETDGLPTSGPEYAKALRRRYREDNPERIRVYRAEYDAAHRERINELQRTAEARKRADLKRAERDAQRKRENARAYYARNRDQVLDANRNAHNRRRDADPDAERERKRLANNAWRDKNRDRENAKLREKHAMNPQAKRDAAARYYQAHGDEIRARRRARYASDRNQERVTHQRWLAREARRIALGLPAARVHRSNPEEKAQHRADADEFFSREWPPDEIARIDRERLAAWERDCFRARAATYLYEEPGIRDRIRRAEYNALRDRRPRQQQPTAAQRAREAENARLDEIARKINQQLRLRPPPRHAHHLDPTHSQATSTSVQKGLHR